MTDASRRSEREPIAWMLVGALAAAAMVLTLYRVFFATPTEATMGVVQKIFYFHVPSAYAMYVGFVVAAVGSAGYLVKRSRTWDAVGVAGAEVGMVFCAIVLTTGPLWARKAWGVWWSWDPRLTTTLLAGMIFAAYLALRSFGAAGEAERKFASGLAIVGVLDLPIIHWSVQKWRGLHPTVITARGGGLDGDMKTTLLIAFVAFTLLVGWLMWTRARIELRRATLDGLESEAAQRGLLEGT